jgi:hypothetical protein
MAGCVACSRNCCLVAASTLRSILACESAAAPQKGGQQAATAAASQPSRSLLACTDGLKGACRQAIQLPAGWLIGWLAACGALLSHARPHHPSIDKIPAAATAAAAAAALPGAGRRKRSRPTWRYCIAIQLNIFGHPRLLLVLGGARSC